VASNEERRIAIMAELVRRAGDSERKHYQALTPTVAKLLQECGSDAVEVMGVFRALIRYAAGIAYGTVGTPIDMQVRTGDDVAGVAVAMWDQACREAEEMVARMKHEGIGIPKELETKLKLAPSDPSKRPDMPPREPDLPTRPTRLADLFDDDEIAEVMKGRGAGGMEN